MTRTGLGLAVKGVVEPAGFRVKGVERLCFLFRIWIQLSL